MLRVAIALLALQCGASFAFVPGFVPAGRAAMALRASPRCRRMRPVVITAALSDGKDIKPSDAQAFASPQAQKELDAQIMEGVTEEGRQELRALADLTKQEQDVLRKKLEDEITLAMTGATIEMLEEYDTKTQAILDNMKRDRDIIREETANLERLAKSMETPLWWKKGENAPKEGQLGSNKFSIPLALAWMFGFAAANEVYQMYLTDEGIQFIGGGKAVFDSFLAIVSGSIAMRKKKKPAAE